MVYNATITPSTTNTTTTTLINYRTPTLLLLLYVIAIIENIVTCVFLMKRSKTDVVYLIMASLVFSNVCIAVDGSVIVSIFFYMSLVSAQAVPTVLCTLVYTCWLLATQISTTLLTLISIVRIVSVKNLLAVSHSKRIFTRTRVTRLVVGIWIISAFLTVIGMVADYVRNVNPPPFCNFRMSLRFMHITTRYFLVAYIVNYLIYVILYTASICVLLRVHTHRRKVSPAAVTTQNQPLPSEVSENASTEFTVRNISTVVSTSKEEQRKAEKSLENNTEFTVRNNLKRIDVRAKTAGSSESGTTSSVPEKTLASVYRQTARRQSRELTATVIVGLLFVMHSFCIIPWIVNLVFLMQDTQSGTWSLLVVLFGIVNVVVDPVIYTVSLPLARKKITTWLKCQCNK